MDVDVAAESAHREYQHHGEPTWGSGKDSRAVRGRCSAQANVKRERAAALKAACEGKLIPTEDELARREGRTYETAAQLLEYILIAPKSGRAAANAKNP